MRREEHPRCWIIFTRMLLITANDIKSGLFKIQILDHYSIFSITDLVINIQKTTFMKKRDFNNTNKSLYKKR